MQFETGKLNVGIKGSKQISMFRRLETFILV